jgi:hypothetical protein
VQIHGKATKLEAVKNLLGCYGVLRKGRLASLKDWEELNHLEGAVALWNAEQKEDLGV